MSNNLLPALPDDVRSAMRVAAAALAELSETPRLDAELLMAHALGVERNRLLLDPTSFQTPDAFAPLLQRRMAQEPVAYIIGYRDFWSLRLAVGPGALIPRPDSETLIEAMLGEVADIHAPLRLLDLGTGPGTLLLAALSELPQSSGLGVDASEAALHYARRNAETSGLNDRVQFQMGDWGTGLSERFDIILNNPPYIGTEEPLIKDVVKFEPASALFAGSDGLDDYRRLMPQFDRLLTDKGLVLLEIGFTQQQAVRELAELAGFSVRCFSDLAGRDRALLLKRIAISG